VRELLTEMEQSFSIPDLQELWQSPIDYREIVLPNLGQRSSARLKVDGKEALVHSTFSLWSNSILLDEGWVPNSDVRGL